MADRMRDEAVAYEAVNLTIKSIANKDNKTIGELAEAAVNKVEEECAAGRLGIFWGSFTRDSDRY